MPVLMSRLKKAGTMDRISLFDRYIKDELSESERKDFLLRLDEDGQFASEFKVFLLSVSGVCQEAEQDNADFGAAMRHISREQLRGVTGAGNGQAPTVKRKFLPWMIQCVSVAAVAVIAFMVVKNVENTAARKVDDAILAAADCEILLSRGPGGDSEPFDLSKMTDDQVAAALPEISGSFDRMDRWSLERADAGFAIALSYLRLHDKEASARVLNNLISEYGMEDEFAGYVNKWKSILKVIE